MKKFRIDEETYAKIVEDLEARNANSENETPTEGENEATVNEVQT